MSKAYFFLMCVDCGCTEQLELNSKPKNEKNYWSFKGNPVQDGGMLAMRCDACQRGERSQCNEASRACTEEKEKG